MNQTVSQNEATKGNATAQPVSLNYPGGFCETFQDYDMAEMALKNRAMEYEGESLEFFSDGQTAETWESKSFTYRNWQGISTFAGKIVGSVGLIYPIV